MLNIKIYENFKELLSERAKLGYRKRAKRFAYWYLKHSGKLTKNIMKTYDYKDCMKSHPYETRQNYFYLKDGRIIEYSRGVYEI